MRPGNAPGRSGPSEQVSGLDQVSFRDENLREVKVPGVHAEAVIEEDPVPREVEVTGQDDPSPRWFSTR